MKKLLFVLVLLLAGYFAWRNVRITAEKPVAAVPSTTSAPAGIPQAEATPGGSLNRAFPEAAAGYKLTFSQEKDGFSQADLTQDGKKVAMLTISDTAANPSARDKFKTSKKQIGGFPSAPVGALGTAVLVGDRYQVQARSAGPAFTAADREAWLARFKLAELATIAKEK
ncbi:MAG: hypothetical protein IPP47_29510 [Bryobacterales bacterium]|nr:hypothetical protein [Bryobacterales bacterium]